MSILNRDSNRWAPYAPTPDTPWDVARVVHLHRRAGFAATWGEIQRDLKEGPSASIERVLTGQARVDGVPPTFSETSALLGDAAVNSYDAGRLKAWWLYRMVFTPDPLTERLTLMWHNHFATGVTKVQNVRLMHRQNELFRQLCRAPFAELLNAAVRDPALMTFLDAPQNRKGHANENLARELMELFTLGIGNYTESDVKEAARALTGWTLVEDEFKDDVPRHDDGEKQILGQTGKWTGTDLVNMLLDHPALAERLTRRLSEQFFGDEVLDQASLNALAQGLRDHNLDIGWAVETILRSEAFFAEKNLRTRVIAPVEFVVGAARVLEMFDRPPSTLLLADWSARLGQDLFDPPNVGGWPGGRRWVSTQSMIGRANFVAALIQGQISRSDEPFDALGLAKRAERGGDLGSMVAFFTELVIGGEPAAGWCDRIASAIGSESTPETARRAAALVLASPEAQVL